ncbi:glycosyltransferase [Palleronia sp.]|uniref:glycosyltransferase n=1 Tax=Palleronia sp. TaxID=1940284 RepID=UPI0035C7E0A5
MPDSALVSVILPAFDVAPYVAEAVTSVAEQDWPEIELVAVDDGSSDGTANILRAISREWRGPGRRMIFIPQENAGAGAARNAGVAAATGDTLLFLDADDRLATDLVRRMITALDAAPDAEIAFPCWHYIDQDGRDFGHASPPANGSFSAVDIMIDNPLHSASGVTVRRAAAERAGGFDPTLAACIDLDFWVRAAPQGGKAILSVPEAIAFYRRRPGQITGNWRRMERGWTRVCEKLAEAGRPLNPEDWRRGRARQCLFWSHIAYQSGEYTAARLLMVECWRRDPRFAASDDLARIRSLSVVASLLPAPLHDRLRARFNARRDGQGD